MSEAEQLAALARIHCVLEREAIEYWLFGGWAVDFHAGSVTRPHDDLDLAVWHEDRDRIQALLSADGWKHAGEQGEDGYTGYVRGTVRLELAFLARDEDGRVYTPLKEGRGDWRDGAFGNDIAELRGVRSRRSASRRSRPTNRNARRPSRGGERPRRRGDSLPRWVNVATQDLTPGLAPRRLLVASNPNLTPRRVLVTL